MPKKDDLDGEQNRMARKLCQSQFRSRDTTYPKKSSTRKMVRRMS